MTFLIICSTIVFRSTRDHRKNELNSTKHRQDREQIETSYKFKLSDDFHKVKNISNVEFNETIEEDNDSIDFRGGSRCEEKLDADIEEFPYSEKRPSAPNDKFNLYSKLVDRTGSHEDLDQRYPKFYRSISLISINLEIGFTIPAAFNFLIHIRFSIDQLDDDDIELSRNNGTRF